jgi:hypothetical protein
VPLLVPSPTPPLSSSLDRPPALQPPGATSPPTRRFLAASVDRSGQFGIAESNDLDDASRLAVVNCRSKPNDGDCGFSDHIPDVDRSPPRKCLAVAQPESAHPGSRGKRAMTSTESSRERAESEALSRCRDWQYPYDVAMDCRIVFQQCY